MNDRTAKFWQAETDSQPVLRRLIWQFGEARGELTVSLALAQPVPNLGRLSDQAVGSMTLDATRLEPGRTVAPAFVFAAVEKDSDNRAVVTQANHRQIPVLQLSPHGKPKDGELDIATLMERSRSALAPAQVDPGDHAAGFLVRQDAVYFYPLAAVTDRDEIESYLLGTGTTDDLVDVLPFQA